MDWLLLKEHLAPGGAGRPCIKSTERFIRDFFHDRISKSIFGILFLFFDCNNVKILKYFWKVESERKKMDRST